MSDFSRFVDVNQPEPEFIIQQVGDAPEIVWEVDYEKRGNPTPRDFETINAAEVKLVVAMADPPDEVQAAVDEAHDAIVNLQEAMMDARDLDDEQRQELRMGNLDALPEVEMR